MPDDFGPVSAEDGAVGEEEDTISDLPRPNLRAPAGTLNVAAAARDKESAGGQLSTRRRWTVGSLFSGQLSSRLTGGQVSSRASSSSAAAGSVSSAIEVLNDAGTKEDAEVIAAAKSLLAFCTDHKKIAEACKVGALEAVSDALKTKMGARDVVFVILPSLINLSSGDDELGLKRVGTLIQAGIIETLAGVLRSHPEDGAMGIRAVWALQHVCRRGTAGTNPWLSRVVTSGVPALVSRMHAAFPEYRALHTRVFFLLSSICYHLTFSGVQAGLPSAAALDKTATRVSVVPSIAAALNTPAPPIVRDSEEVHEAAALALGDACASADITALAVQHRGVEGLVLAMEAQPAAGALQENGCWAIRQICTAAEPAVRAQVAATGAPRAIIHALLAVQWPKFTRLAGLREKGCRALIALCGPNPMSESASGSGVEDLLAVRKQLAELGALEAACVALANHPTETGVVAYACDLLFTVCSGFDPGHSRKRQAAASDAIPSVIEALKKAKGKKNADEAIEAAYNTLDLITTGGADLLEAAMALGYTPPSAPLEA